MALVVDACEEKGFVIIEYTDQSWRSRVVQWKAIIMTKMGHMVPVEGRRYTVK
jgi:hypothetical protein